MNAERRKEINKALALIAEAKEIIEIVKDGEQDAYDNLPESFQNGERGEAMQTAIDNLDSVYGDIENVESELQTVVEG